MAEIPNLAGVATADLVEKIGAGSFQASYINWSRTLNLLRVNAPGWLPELVPTATGAILHEAPVGAFLLIRFRHADGTVTPEVPQAIMDHKNAAVPTSKVTARDITDTHRRGVCMAAALTFGLAYELWAKVALESGYGEAAEQPSAAPGLSATGRVSPTDGVWEALGDDERAFLQSIADDLVSRLANDPADAIDYLDGQLLQADEKTALWTRLDSKARSAIKKAYANRQKEVA